MVGDGAAGERGRQVRGDELARLADFRVGRLAVQPPTRLRLPEKCVFPKTFESALCNVTLHL